MAESRRSGARAPSVNAPYVVYMGARKPNVFSNAMREVQPEKTNIYYEYAADFHLRQEVTPEKTVFFVGEVCKKGNFGCSYIYYFVYRLK
jgi:hypothetical protein